MPDPIAAVDHEAEEEPDDEAYPGVEARLTKRRRNTRTVPRVSVKRGGRWIPKSWRRLTTFALHPEATVAALKAYSRMRSQPMIQAKISPRVA